VRGRWPEVARILDVALELTPEQRPAFLERACAGDAELRTEVEAVLAGAEAEAFLKVPATELAGPLLDTAVAMEEVIGPYRLVRELGHGGMGVVYLAERADGQFEQRVALKLIKRGMDSEEILRRFLAERQVLARLSHAHIARLLDGGVTPAGQPWFAMEYVDGVPLHRYCGDRGLGIEELLAVFVKVCEAVQYAHRNLVVHRDLKPSNILVTAGGEIKLLDFGIAKVLTQEPADETVTRAEQRLMTPEYAAPEQLRGEPVTTATDVYALGAILYLLLTGQPAHRLAGRTAAERERVICELEPDPPSEAVRGTGRERLRRRLAGDLDTIVLQALRKEPVRRYPSVEALLDDLERHRTGLPVRARAASIGYRARKFFGRHRLAGGVAAVVFLALAAGLGGTLWQARATSREAAKARVVKDFVVGLFRVSQPEESRGRDITARELLERGARRVDSGLARQPELQAELLDVLGVIHRDLGMYPEADSLLARAVRLTRARYGERHPQVAAKSIDWAAVLAARGEYARAESLLVAALGMLRRTGAPEDSLLATALGALASVRRLRGNFAGAESLYREALRIDAGPDAEGRLRVAEHLDNLGLVLEEAGELTRADSTYQAALGLRRRLLDPDHPQVIMSLYHLATLREKQGEFPEAERLQREVLKRRMRLYPAGHPEVAYALQGLANTLQIQGGYAEAESLDVEALAILRARLGTDHPETLELVSALATLKYEKGDLVGAEAAFRELLAAWRRSLGPEHPTTLQALNDVAAILKYQRRYAEAEPLYRETLALRRKRLGSSHPEVAASWGNLAELLQETGGLAESERAYREQLAIMEAVLPAGHVHIAGALIGLGGILTDRGKASEAEPMLRQALAMRIEKLGPADRRVARAQRALGLSLAAQGRHAEAEKPLLESYRTLGSAGNWFHRTLREQTRLDLVAFYRSWGKRAEAAKYLARSAERAW
jgi:tetratricopeptide (TPR) repeat protein/predicted Ser/Thr protein kinase